MGSTRSSGVGNGRSSGGGAEDDGGEPPERARSRSDDQKRKGNIGRPRNKPPPPPREVPIEIIPRPQEGGQHRKRRLSTPTAGASTQVSRSRTTGYQAAPSADIAQNNRPTGPNRPREPRKLSNNLKEGEYLTTVTLLSPNGVEVAVPNCLISPYWNYSFIFPEAVEAIGYEPHILPDDESRTSVTPRGDNKDNKLVGLYMELKEMNRPRELIVLPIFHKRKLGVSLVLGRPVIENWPPSVDTQYVAGDWEADMPTYDMDQAPWYHGFWDSDDGAGIEAAMEPNVYLSGLGNNTINQDLTAVGAGIPADYPEFIPEWDGYLQEN